MGNFPKDSSERKKESKAMQIFHNNLDVDHWVLRFETNKDVGRDCIIELSENDEFHNKKIECQIKGRSMLNLVNDNISFQIATKTCNYAISSHVPFCLFLVNLENKKIYYLYLNKYFNENEEKCKKLDKQESINLHIPKNNVFDDRKIIEIAKMKDYIMKY